MAPRTSAYEPAADAPFTDAEREAAGLGPLGFVPRARGSYRSEARQRDRAARDRYEAEDAALANESEGLGGMPLDLSRPQPAPTRQSRRQLRRLGSGVAQGASATGALVSGRKPIGLAAGVLGVLLYAAGINYLQGRWPQLKGWLGAKFANTPYVATTAKTTATLDAAVTSSSSSSSAAIVKPGSRIAA